MLRLVRGFTKEEKVSACIFIEDPAETSEATTIGGRLIRVVIVDPERTYETPALERVSGSLEARETEDTEAPSDAPDPEKV